MKPVIYFLAPNPDTFPSGGNIYNQSLARALREKGYQVEFVQDWPTSEGLYIVDSLFCKNWKSERAKTDTSILLAHLLPGMLEGEINQEITPLEEGWAGAITTGVSTSDYLLKSGWNPEKVLLLEPGIEQVFSVPKRRVSPLKIAWVSNLLPNKGVLAFLEELQPWHQQMKEAGVRINLAGSDQMDKEYAKSCLEKLKKLNGLVEYLGPISSSEIRGLLKKSNLFLSTSTFETFGMALQEARIFGLPILALASGSGSHNLGGMEHIESYSEQVERILDWSRNPEKMQRLLDLALIDRETYSKQQNDWVRQTEKLIRFFPDLF